MLYALVVHKYITEGQKWNALLKKKGYMVLSVCSELSAMIDVMMRKRVHIVFCSEDLVVSNSIMALKASAEFFPRIKFVVVGALQKTFASTAAVNSVRAKIENRMLRLVSNVRNIETQIITSTIIPEINVINASLIFHPPQTSR